MMTVGFRPFDGIGNNLLHTDWGSAGEQLLRIAAAEYGDGISTPAGSDRASARAISDLIAAQGEDTPNSREMSAFVYAFGQFLDHDLDLTASGSPTETFSIPVPAGDPLFDPTGTGTQTIFLARSVYDPATGTSTSNPRQQLNQITAFLDGSQVYGSDADRARALRTLIGGRLKTSDGDMLPFNTMGLSNDNPLGAAADSLFVAGDVRANENIELTAMHTLFVREHNYWADKLAAQHPDWNDEMLYQHARRMVVAELQAITYSEFLPALLGHKLAPYRGYNANVNPGIATEFSTAGFRLGHTMLGADVEFLDNNGNALRDEVELREAFFNPQLIAETGIDSILKYLASDPAQEVDAMVVDDVRNFLFGQPGQGGLDLVSLNIQRGRDHGLADYNATRVAYGLKPVASFAEITSDVETQNALREAYGDVNNVDLFVGAISEDHIRGTSVGPLLSRILTDQFARLRDGDRFWYERDLSRAELGTVQNTTLADIIARNTTTTNLQANVFFFSPGVSGRLFGDANGNARMDGREQGLAGVTVELLDADGNLLASTVTRRDGSYTFDGVDVGRYQVRVASASGRPAVTQTVDVTRGDAAQANIAMAVTAQPTKPRRDSRDLTDRDPSSDRPTGPFGRLGLRDGRRR
jgi:hypothetical protein